MLKQSEIEEYLAQNHVVVEEEQKTLDIENEMKQYENQYREAGGGNKKYRRLQSAKVRNESLGQEIPKLGRPISSYGKKQSPFVHQPSFSNTNQETGTAGPSSSKNHRYTRRGRGPMSGSTSEQILLDSLKVKSINEVATMAVLMAENRKFRQLEKMKQKQRKMTRKMSAKKANVQVLC